MSAQTRPLPLCPAACAQLRSGTKLSEDTRKQRSRIITARLRRLPASTRPLTALGTMEDTPPSSTPALRGFDLQADRRSVARVKGGTYEGVVQEKDDFSWEPRR